MPLPGSILTLALAVLLGGCMSSYSPPGPVVTLLREKGELSVGANVRPIFPARGANVYAAAAPTDGARIYVQGNLARYKGRHATDFSERDMHEKNHTTQVEAAAGWAFRDGRKVLELFAGAGYGRTDAHACRREYNINGNYGVDCGLWVDSESWFVRPFLQIDGGFHHRFGSVGWGVRSAAVRHAFERLLGEPSDRSATAVTLEPIMSASFGLPWGKLEAGFTIPVVLYSPKARYVRRYDEYYSTPRTEVFEARLIETASPRITLGIRADLHHLWRTSEP